MGPKRAHQSKKKAQGPKARLSASARRTRTMAVATALVCGLILAAWFPFSGLLDQHRALDAEAAQLSTLKSQDQALRNEEQSLSSGADVGRIARQRYGLENPGVRSYQVLPPASSAPAGTYPGDPANQPLVKPSTGVDIAPSIKSHHARSRKAAAPSGLFSRILHTLEFWH